MPTPTTNRTFTKPDVGVDDDDWGAILNNQLDTLDALFNGTARVPNADLNAARVRGRLTLDQAPVMAVHSETNSGTLEIGPESEGLFVVAATQGDVVVDATNMVEGQVVDLVVVPRNRTITWQGAVFTNGTTGPGTLGIINYIRLAHINVPAIGVTVLGVNLTP